MCSLFDTSGSMSGEWKRGKARLLRHRQTKGPETDRPNLHDRATPRLYPFAIPTPDRSAVADGLGTPSRDHPCFRGPGRLEAGR
jgi:hypothetical protein